MRPTQMTHPVDPMLELDYRATTTDLCQFLRDQLLEAPRHRGYVVGISGGIDSAVAAALCVEAVGRERVHAVLLPERESQAAGQRLARQLLEHLDLPSKEIDIAPTLETLGVYEQREKLVRELFPEFTSGWTYRLVMPGALADSAALSVYRLEALRPNGSVESVRPGVDALRRLQAFTNVKQRVRMTLLYREAEARGDLVCGTTNRSELALGFFVRHGDGGVDVEPLAALFKTQVRALGRHMGLPEEIVSQEASPDTWSAPVSDREFYMRMGYSELDRILARIEAKDSPAEIAEELELDPSYVDRVCSELERRRRATTRHRQLARTPHDEDGLA